MEAKTFDKMNLVTWIARILTGALFIFSGLIKANDPYGFAYKLDEYFTIFHTPFFMNYSVGLSIIICISEVMMGLWLLIGYKPVLNTWALLILIIFFDFLTGYTALANLAKANPKWGFSVWMAELMGAKDNNPEMMNALSDCGCFGDFIKLKPYESFFKDVVLTILIVILFIRRKNIHPLMNPTVSAIVSFTAGFVSVAFPIYCYMFLPVKDFLPYAEGKDLVKQMETPPGAPQDSFVMTFIYKNPTSGETKSFNMDSLPSAPWTFVDRTQVLVREGYHPPIHDFHLFNKEHEEFTDIITEQEGFKLVFIIKSLDLVSNGTYKKLGELSKELKKSNPDLKIFTLTSSPYDQIEAVSKTNGLDFPFYSCDNTVLKTMVRSCPGVMLFNKSTVVKKWSAYKIPSEETVNKLAKK